jgi:GrpB-like predicted nucleotidyltransferase (UPF0157 family)
MMREHRTQWESIFAREARRIDAQLGNTARQIVHVGSTAITTIRAKDVIDMAIGVASEDAIGRCALCLRCLGYNTSLIDAPGWRALRRVTGGTAFHAHVVLYGGDAWRNFVEWRDYLNDSATAARQYEEVKTRLAEFFRLPRSSYIAVKRRYIDEINVMRARSAGGFGCY